MFYKVEELGSRNVVIFDADVSGGEAYDLTQTADDIHDGDILVLPGEEVVGIMVEAWPCVVHGDSDAFHAVGIVGLPGKYAAALQAAQQIAKEGFA